MYGLVWRQPYALLCGARYVWVCMGPGVYGSVWGQMCMGLCGARCTIYGSVYSVGPAIHVYRSVWDQVCMVLSVLCVCWARCLRVCVGLVMFIGLCVAWYKLVQYDIWGICLCTV